MHRPAIIGCLVLSLVVLPASGGIPEEARFELDGVMYLYATGVLDTESIMLGMGADGAGGLPMRACAFVMMHPGTPNGRILVEARYDNVTPVQFSVENFVQPNGTLGYAYDTPVEHSGQPTVVADLVAIGNATMRSNGARYFDPVSAQFDPTLPQPPEPLAYLDADREAPKLLGSLYISSEGTRDNATRAILGEAAPNDIEMHLRVESRPEAPPRTRTHTFSSYGTPVPVGAPSEAFGAHHQFNNIKFGGNAHIEIATTATAPAGMNEFTFSVRDPASNEVLNVTLAPALLADDTATLDLPLTAFGIYGIQVSGKVALGGYTITVELQPPEEFELNMWWENVTFGAQAYDDYQSCRKDIVNPNKVYPAQSIVRRPDPPEMALKLIVVGVIAAVGLVTIGVKLLSDQIAGAAFRKSK